jgi:hypothetical protein
MADIHKFSVIEAGNVGLGQAGSAFLTDADSKYTPQDDRVIIAIQVIETCTFKAGTTPENDNFTGFAAAEAGTNADAFGGTEDFQTGTTIYGRWTEVTIGKGAVMLYMGS